MARLNLPCVEVDLNGMEVNALVDTGCSRSIVSRKVCEGMTFSPVRERVVTMSGDDVLCLDAVVLNVSVEGVVLALDCLVCNILPQYQMLLGMDAISKLGGIYIEDGNIVIGKNVAAVSGGAKPEEACTALSVKDVDFEAYFEEGKWTVKWVYDRLPDFCNNVSQYRVPEGAEEEFCRELDNWIEDGWLTPYDGEYDAVLPLMAVVQKNKAKVRMLECFPLERMLQHAVSGGATCISPKKLARL